MIYSASCGGHRKDDQIVGVHAHRLALAGHDPDHAKTPVAEPYPLADRPARPEYLLPDPMTQYGDRITVVDVTRRKELAFTHLHMAHRKQVGSRAKHDHLAIQRAV
jgi:hypothetical protein